MSDNLLYTVVIMMKTDSPTLDAAMKRVEIVVMMNILFSSDPE